MQLTFSSPIEAADEGRRIISGQIVPFGEIGATSVGKVIFERGSIEIPNATKVKLLAQHEKTASGVIGRAQSFHETPTGINGTFKVSASKDGENYLIKASEGLLDGLSVGVDVIASKDRKDGVIVVTAAILREVSLVESPAFNSARVVDVAAEETEISAPEGAEETQTESEPNVEDTTTPAATTETAAAPVEAAEAARPVIKANGYTFNSQTVRHGITSAGRYVEHKLKAAAGNEESKLWIAAAESMTAADTTSNNPAFVPQQYLTNMFVSNTNFGRSTIDAVTKATLPNAGMTLNVPSLVTAAGGGSSVAPTVAETGENSAPSNTTMTSAYETISVKKFSGQQVVTLELLERSDPIFFDQLSIQLQRAMAKAQDEYMVAELVASGTGSASPLVDTALEFQAFVAGQTAAAYKGSSYFAQNLIISPEWWSAIQTFADTTNRPIYTLASPQFNAGGQLVPTSIKGTALGLDVYVDRYVTAGAGDTDYTMFVVAPETAYWWESPSATFAVNHVADATGNMVLQTSLYSYGAAKVLIPAGVRKYTHS